jgi:hypothetical protein
MMNIGIANFVFITVEFGCSKFGRKKRELKEGLIERRE